MALLLSHKGAAKELGIGEEAVRSLIRDGRLRYIPVGKERKLPLVELERFIDRELEKCLSKSGQTTGTGSLASTGQTEPDTAGPTKRRITPGANLRPWNDNSAQKAGSRRKTANGRT